MRNFVIIILFLISFPLIHGQIIVGSVYDQSTNSPLSDAAIYINRTSIGTVSDSEGNFKLDVSNYNTLPITISLLGYYSNTLSEYSSNKSYKIYLEPKITQLNEILLTGKNNDWKRHYKLFKKEFLGETKNAMSCDIINSDVLSFYFDAENETLEAFSIQPIIIHNRSLAYNITYYLDKFKYSRIVQEKPMYTDLLKSKPEISEKLIIIGNYLFEDELADLNETEQKKVIEKRKSAYLGSRMHFFRLLHRGNLLQKGSKSVLLTDLSLNLNAFKIVSNQTIGSDSFVHHYDAISSFFNKSGEFDIHYKTDKSKLTITRDSVQFQRNGYFDPIGIIFDGDMSKKRMGDLLPFEYEMKE